MALCVVCNLDLDGVLPPEGGSQYLTGNGYHAATCFPQPPTAYVCAVVGCNATAPWNGTEGWDLTGPVHCPDHA